MIKRDQTHQIAAHVFSVDASDLGWKPGEFPPRVDTDLGNGQPLACDHCYSQHGSIEYVTYKQVLGCVTVRVFND